MKFSKSSPVRYSARFSAAIIIRNEREIYNKPSNVKLTFRACALSGFFPNGGAAGVFSGGQCGTRERVIADTALLPLRSIL